LQKCFVHRRFCKGLFFISGDCPKTVPIGLILFRSHRSFDTQLTLAGSFYAVASRHLRSYWMV